MNAIPSSSTLMVRSTEAGFEGSWHPGEVIHCEELERHIKYDNVLDDNGVNYLVEKVTVSEALDGHRRYYENCYERGSIRPVPPMVDFEKWDVRFGLCVDAYVEDAWWEGVIFDHYDDMEERKVFFPDLGDEMQVGMREMRITQDWDEVTEEWMRRGKWVFLELVEKWGSKLFVTVSPKQIWYDVRIRKKFDKIQEWTCNIEFLWKDVVKEVINDYLSLTIEEVITFLNVGESLSNKATELESFEAVVANGEEVLPELEAAAGIHPTVDCHISDAPLNPSANIQNPYILPPTVPSSPVEHEVEDKPEFCPEAVERYYQSHITKQSRAYKRKLIPKAKKHLLAVGWVFDYPPPTHRKRGIIYISPRNRKFPTLHAACLFCIKQTKLSDMQPVNISSINEENVDRVQGGELVCKASQLLPMNTEFQAMDGDAASRSIVNRKRRSLRDSKGNTPKCQKSTRVLRSNKRVQKVSNPSPLHYKPLNALSFLIDSGVIVPRSKVYYKAKGRQGTVRTWAVGRITLDGIKCDCCLKIYSFVGFENHAIGSKTCKPSANIFLEDERSLLDCQIEMMQGHEARETSGKSPSNFSLAENDHICSVCQCGGDLILCDQCPSSFHKACLGFEDIPDGDWFCPSCRCGICGQRNIDGDEDKHVVTCIQCEHKYHVRCLKTGSADLSIYLGNWFCGEDCEKIYEGLHKLLGEPVSVGVDNLTWTLVKFINPDSCDELGSIKSELMAESYCKLNLALSVMHECFEPLKESITSRDLVEDVLFSRRSDLNRLNFQGFYTVLLERNEELISVATVRVYGKKVAELPLVGTRLQYRRQGMCRILINELEKHHYMVLHFSLMLNLMGMQ